jgi:hypothetical protein
MVRILIAALAALWFVNAAAAAPLVAPCTEASQVAAECDPVNSTNPLPVAPDQYPAGSTPIIASGSGTTGSIAVAIPAVALKTAYLCGFIDDAVATASTTGGNSIAGLLGGTFSYIQQIGKVDGSISGHYSQLFSPCLPASAVNTQILMTSSAPGSGGSQGVVMWGYYK